MLLKKIVLKNFRQYKGEQVVEFSTDPSRNVTLILGQNTSGKTTFIQAFRWVLYEDSDFTGKGKSSVINHDVRRSMRKGEIEDVSVMLLIQHHGVDYKITRVQPFKSTISGDAKPDRESLLTVHYYDDNGNERPIDTPPKIKIDEILPESLSEYFFFDGEKIASSRKKQNVEASINSIMGLTPIRAMMDHLNPNSTRNSVINNLKQQRVPDESGKIYELQRIIKNKESELENCRDLASTYDKNIKRLDEEKEKLYGDFIKIEAIAEKARELKDLESKRKNISQKMLVDSNQAMGAFGNCMYDIFLSYLSRVLLEKLNKEEFVDKGVPDMTAVSVQFLLDRGACICGNSFSEHPECKEKLVDLLSYLPPESIGNQINHLTKTLEDYAELENNTFEAYFSAYLSTCESYDEIDLKIRQLEIEIGSSKDADKTNDKYVSVSKQLEKERDYIKGTNSKIAILDNEITKLNESLDKVSKESGKNIDVDMQIEYALALYNRAKNTYDVKSKEVLKLARETLTQVFNSMYHGNRTIELKDNYDVVLSVSGTELDTSKGLETVANFAFISTLLKIAKDNMVADENGIVSEPYPLAMDAVFSNTDDKHIVNICNVFPDLAEQAILAIMEKDWMNAKKSLQSKVGKIYRLNKHSESYTSIEEESIDE